MLDPLNIPILDKRLTEMKSIPTQVIIFGEAIIWCKNIKKIIETKKYEDFRLIL